MKKDPGKHTIVLTTTKEKQFLVDFVNLIGFPRDDSMKPGRYNTVGLKQMDYPINKLRLNAYYNYPPLVGTISELIEEILFYNNKNYLYSNLFKYITVKKLRKELNEQLIS